MITLNGRQLKSHIATQRELLLRCWQLQQLRNNDFALLPQLQELAVGLDETSADRGWSSVRMCNAPNCRCAVSPGKVSSRSCLTPTEELVHQLHPGFDDNGMMIALQPSGLSPIMSPKEPPQSSAEKSRTPRSV